MLELKDIKKYYQVGETTTKALDGVSVAFRKKEFVAILGPSGSGKTTMLNVIGGLDNYDSGDMVINGKSTKDFKDSDWDAYRNNSIGFIFQSYNLIHHLGIIDNVELGMTLSGVDKAEKTKRAEEALRRVGLAEHMHKKPNQLSGGQMQRVAIARALANDPDILLCDEPTGALDTETSVQIMQLIQELSKEKLVIMVTHNPKLATEYADRIIEFSDGKIRHDSHPHIEGQKKEPFSLKHTKMKFTTALKLSFNNIRTKKGRTFLTAFASSIGIISIGIVLSLSNGFQKQIDSTQQETLANYPVTISPSATSLDANSNPNGKATKEQEEQRKADAVFAKKSILEENTHLNVITSDYVDYIKGIDPELSNDVVFTYSAALNLARDIDGTMTQVKFSNVDENSNSQTAMMSSMMETGVSVIPTALKGDNNFLSNNYQLVAGSWPKETTDVVLVLDENHETNYHALANLGFNVTDNEKFAYDDLLGTEVTALTNDNYYTELPTGNFVPTSDLAGSVAKSGNLTLKVAGIIQPQADAKMAVLAKGIAYQEGLVTELLKANENSQIVTAQKEANVNVMTNEAVDDSSKENLLAYFGGSSVPASIMIYPNNFSDKDEILTYLDAYNKDKKDADKIIYTDLAGTMTQLTGGLMDAVTYVLVAFAGISLVTSMIMIAIITYTSVIERTKEIGVLKALGARKKDITRVFDAETCLLGVGSGLLGILIAYLATFPINALLENLTDLKNVAQLNPVHAVVLVIVSTILTILGGHVPARMAAKKDAAEALRAE